MGESGRSEIAAHLSKMNILKSFYGFELNDDLIFHEGIEFVHPNQLVVVMDRHFLLEFHLKALSLALDLKAVFINRFQKSGAFIPVDGDRGANEALGDALKFQGHAEEESRMKRDE